MLDPPRRPSRSFREMDILGEAGRIIFPLASFARKAYNKQAKPSFKGE